MKLSLSQKTDFLKKAAFIANQSTCGYKVGCIGVCELNSDYSQIFDENVKSSNSLLYIKTWNETLSGEIYCQKVDENGKRICIREIENLRGREFQKVCSIHAEASLIATCAKYGIKTDGMIIFLTNSPCYICAKSVIKAGISEVYYIAEHTDTSGIDLLKENNILVEKIDPHL